MMCRDIFDMSMDEFLYEHSIGSINEMVRIYNEQQESIQEKDSSIGSGVKEYDNPQEFFKL